MTTFPAFPKIIAPLDFSQYLKAYRSYALTVIAKTDPQLRELQRYFNEEFIYWFLQANIYVAFDQDRNMMMRATGKIELQKCKFNGSWTEAGFVCGILSFYQMHFDGTTIKVGKNSFPIQTQTETEVVYTANKFTIHISLLSFMLTIMYKENDFMLTLISEPDRRATATSCPFASAHYTTFRGFIHGFGHHLNVLVSCEGVFIKHQVKYEMSTENFWHILLANPKAIFASLQRFTEFVSDNVAKEIYQEQVAES